MIAKETTAIIIIRTKFKHHQSIKASIIEENK